MNTPLIAATVLALAAGGAALAQQPAPPAAPAPTLSPTLAPALAPALAPQDAPPPPGMGGWRHGHGMHGGMMPMRPPTTKAAVFHIRRGDTRIDVKCADDEPSAACVDAAVRLMDKLGAPAR